MEKMIDKVKRKLWTFGYSVKDVSGAGLGFDLIVNDQFKVKVIGMDEAHASVKGVVNAVVGKDGSIAYTRGSKVETSPIKAFPKVDTK